MISFTEKAANKVLNIMQDQKVSGDPAVRVGVRGGGCSGFTYTVDFDRYIDIQDGSTTEEKTVSVKVTTNDWVVVQYGTTLANLYWK